MNDPLSPVEDYFANVVLRVDIARCGSDGAAVGDAVCFAVDTNLWLHGGDEYRAQVIGSLDESIRAFLPGSPLPEC